MSKIVDDKNLETLSVKLGNKEKAEEVLKLLDNYNKYTMRFKKKINDILKPNGYRILTGIQFKNLEEKEELNGNER